MKTIKFAYKAFVFILYKLFLYSGVYWLVKGRFINCGSCAEEPDGSYLCLLDGVNEVENFRDLIPRQVFENVIEEADRICEHKFYVFDKTFYFASNINWKVSENPQFTWPNKKWFLVDLNDKRAGDVKYTWELNRFNHLFILGRAYAFSKEKKYLLEYKREISDWILQNPPEIGINWSSGLEISLRAISWILSFEFLRRDIVDDEKFLQDFNCALFTFGQHLYENIFYSEIFLKNNHLVAEVVGLVLISYFFDCETSKIWREKAFKILRKEIINQIRYDGSSIENSSSYSIFSIYLLVLLIIILKKKGECIDDLLLRRIEKGLEVIRAIRKINDSFVNYGDSDDAKVILLSNSSQLEDLLNIASVIFEREDFKVSSSNDFQESIFWLFGEKGLSNLNSMNPVSEEKRFVFCPEGGIGIYKNEKGDLLFVQLNGASGHGHAGIGHFELSVNGKDVIIDSGTYKYNCSRDERNYFRSASAHNLLTVDSIPQDIPLRRFQWLSNSVVMDRGYKDNPISFFVEYYFPRYSFTKFLHRREFFFYPEEGFLTVLDFLKFKGEHFIKEIFHISPLAKEFEFSDKGFLKGKIRDQEFDLVVGYLNTSTSLRPSFISGVIKQSWFSPRYGSKILSSAAVFQEEIKCPALVVSLISLGNKDVLSVYDNAISNAISKLKEDFL